LDRISVVFVSGFKGKIMKERSVPVLVSLIFFYHCKLTGTGTEEIFVNKNLKSVTLQKEGKVVHYLPFSCFLRLLNIFSSRFLNPA
jgi:hypothetical protein